MQCLRSRGTSATKSCAALPDLSDQLRSVGYSLGVDVVPDRRLALPELWGKGVIRLKTEYLNMNTRQLINQVEHIMDSHKTKAASWSEQPSSSVRSKINQHFEEAAREISRLLEDHFRREPEDRS